MDKRPSTTDSRDGVAVVERAPGTVQVRHGIHGGVGSTTMRLVESVAHAPFTLLEWTLPPQSSEGIHSHGHDHVGLEQYFVLDGVLVVVVGPDRYELSAGDSVAVPPGLDRAVRNESTADARVLLVYQTS